MRKPTLSGFLWAMAQSVLRDAMAVSSCSEQVFRYNTPVSVAFADFAESSLPTTDELPARKSRPTQVDAGSIELRFALVVAGLFDFFLLFAVPCAIWKGTVWAKLGSSWPLAAYLVPVLFLSVLLSSHGQSIGNVVTGTVIVRTYASGIDGHEAMALEQRPRTGLRYTLLPVLLHALGVGLAYLVIPPSLEFMMEANYMRVGWISEASEPFEKTVNHAPDDKILGIERKILPRDASSGASEIETDVLVSLRRRPCNDMKHLLVFMGVTYGFWSLVIALKGGVQAEDSHLVEVVTRRFLGIFGGPSVVYAMSMFCLHLVLILCICLAVRSLCRPLLWACWSLIAVGCICLLFAVLIGVGPPFVSWKFIVYIGGEQLINTLLFGSPVVRIVTCCIAMPFVIFFISSVAFGLVNCRCRGPCHGPPEKDDDIKFRRTMNMLLECWRETVLWMVAQPLLVLHLSVMQLLLTLYKVSIVDAILSHMSRPT